jgi:hypothetical protein
MFPTVATTVGSIHQLISTILNRSLVPHPDDLLSHKSERRLCRQHHAATTRVRHPHQVLTTILFGAMDTQPSIARSHNMLPLHHSATLSLPLLRLSCRPLNLQGQPS